VNQFKVEIARDAFDSPIEFDVGSRNAPHIAVTGASGAGKSAFAQFLLRELICGPDPIIVAGVDLSSVLLHPLLDLPGQEFRSIGGESAEPHVEVLERITDEMNRRLRMLLNSGGDKFTVFTDELPLLLVVFEEFPSLIAMAEEEDQSRPRERTKYAASIKRAFGRVVRLGAKLGVIALVLAQRGDASVLGGDVRSSIAARITFRAENPTAVQMMHPFGWEEHVAAAHSFRPGQGLIETPNRPLERASFAHITYAEYVHSVSAHRSVSE